MIWDDFCYDGVWLSSFNMKVYNPENDPVFVEREFDKSEITSVRSIPNHFSAHYVDALTFEMLIVKDVEKYLYQYDWALDGDEVNELRAWLESAKIPTEFIAPIKQDSENIHYFGIFTSVQPFFANAQCYGLLLTFTCSAPYGFSDEFAKTMAFNGATTLTTKIYNKSAEKKEYLKPKIVITYSYISANSSKVTIENATDGHNKMSLKLPQYSNKLIIDCEKRIITNENGNLIPLHAVNVTAPTTNDYNFITADRYMFYWLRLLPGDNTVKVTTPESSGLYSVEISGRYVLKSGGF